MEDYILREINRIGELIAALMAKIGLMRQSASPEQIRTTAKTELAEKLDIDIDTLLDEPDFIGRLTDEYGFGDQELDKFAELLFDTPPIRAITGSFAPQGTKVAVIMVRRRSLSCSMVLDAMMPGIPQPEEIKSGIKLFPDNPK